MDAMPAFHFNGMVMLVLNVSDGDDFVIDAYISVLY